MKIDTIKQLDSKTPLKHGQDTVYFRGVVEPTTKGGKRTIKVSTTPTGRNFKEVNPLALKLAEPVPA